MQSIKAQPARRSVILKHNIYGSSRVGIKNTNKRVTALAYNIQGGVSDIIIPETINPLDPVKRSLGEKQYELSNHLGNVLVTVSDRKLAEGTEGSTASGYRAEVLFASDYYPFGMLEQSGDPDWSKAERHGQMPGRQFSAEEYRYGFNGMEKDDEWKGEGNSFTTFHRALDTRIGRWLSQDPVIRENGTIYCLSSNNPIARIDPNGADDFYSNDGTFLFSTSFGDQVRVISNTNKVSKILSVYQGMEDQNERLMTISLRKNGTINLTEMSLAPATSKRAANKIFENIRNSELGIETPIGVKKNAG
jgi:RHS repeat-associated protein